MWGLAEGSQPQVPTASLGSTRAQIRVKQRRLAQPCARMTRKLMKLSFSVFYT